jgi:hypothetical protein
MYSEYGSKKCFDSKIPNIGHIVTQYMSSITICGHSIIVSR